MNFAEREEAIVHK